MKLPGSPRAHVWAGLVMAFVGVAVGSFAYTGDRQYHIVYVAVAFLGFALLVAGSTLAAWGQARKPRIAPVARASEHAGGAERAKKPQVAKRSREAKSAPREIETRLSCPQCSNAFVARGVPPFEAKCPQCGFRGTIGAP